MGAAGITVGSPDRRRASPALCEELRTAQVGHAGGPLLRSTHHCVSLGPSLAYRWEQQAGHRLRGTSDAPKDESESSGTLIALGHGQLVPRWLQGGYKMNGTHPERRQTREDTWGQKEGGDSKVAEGQSAWCCPTPAVRLWAGGATPWATFPSPEQQVPVTQGQENPCGQSLDGQPSRRPCPLPRWWRLGRWSRVEFRAAQPLRVLPPPVLPRLLS